MDEDEASNSLLRGWRSYYKVYEYTGVWLRDVKCIFPILTCICSLPMNTSSSKWHGSSPGDRHQVWWLCWKTDHQYYQVWSSYSATAQHHKHHQQRWKKNLGSKYLYHSFSIKFQKILLSVRYIFLQLIKNFLILKFEYSQFCCLKPC